jgi:hypothetical protein
MSVGSNKECPPVEERYQDAGDLIHRLGRAQELGPAIEPFCLLLFLAFSMTIIEVGVFDSKLLF